MSKPPVIARSNGGLGGDEAIYKLVIDRLLRPFRARNDSISSSSIITTVVLAVFVACTYSAVSYADGIGSLAEVGKSMDAAKKELDQETANYNKVNGAIESGALQKGLSRQAVLSQYGEPVVMNEDLSTKRERWVYKPASSSFFEGERIYLFFNVSGTLDEVKIVSD